MFNPRLFPALTASLILALPAMPDAWHPTPASGLKEYQVKCLVYDLRSDKNRLQFRLENGMDYLYPFNPSDAVQLSKAHFIYGMLMAARTAKEVVSVYVTNEATANPTLISVQVGPNP